MSVVFHGHTHLTDQTLVLLLDRELQDRRTAGALKHLGGCADCRGRLGDLARGLEHVRAACEGRPSDADQPLAAAARRRLRLRLARESARADRSLAARLLAPGHAERPWVFGSAVLLFALLALGRDPGPPPPPDAAARPAAVFLMPDRRLTPGAARTVTVNQACASRRARDVRPISASVHERVFSDYGTDIRKAADYELDRLITPELGGTDDPANLWPQAYGALWSAYVKDDLERYFHQEVCDGRMDVATAQQEMATDWIGAYKRHFRTDTPLRDYRTSPLTSLDRDFVLSELEEAGLTTDHLRIGVSRHNE